jgi:hypothetical protein
MKGYKLVLETEDKRYSAILPYALSKLHKNKLGTKLGKYTVPGEFYYSIGTQVVAPANSMGLFIFTNKDDIPNFCAHYKSVEAGRLTQETIPRIAEVEYSEADIIGTYEKEFLDKPTVAILLSKLIITSIARL